MRPAEMANTRERPALQIAAITDRASLKEVQRYTATADRKRLAKSAIEKIRAIRRGD
jgi:hypothetical protein